VSASTKIVEFAEKYEKEFSLEDFPGPIKLPTRSVFDLKLALSFNCQ
jgi:hypothetical protein